MAIKTIKIDSFVEIQGFSRARVKDIRNGLYYFDGLEGGFSAKEIKLIPDAPKPLKKSEIKSSNKPLKRVPLKPGKKKIKPVSEKRQKEIKQYIKDREEFLNKNTECQAKLKNCSFLSDQVHHKGGREGDLLLDQTKWLAICAGCHTIVTEQSRMAIETGLSLPRNT